MDSEIRNLIDFDNVYIGLVHPKNGDPYWMVSIYFGIEPVKDVPIAYKFSFSSIDEMDKAKKEAKEFAEKLQKTLDFWKGEK